VAAQSIQTHRGLQSLTGNRDEKPK